MAGTRKNPRRGGGGWSSSPNQWKTPQSTRKGPKGCAPALIVMLGGLAGVIAGVGAIWHIL